MVMIKRKPQTKTTKLPSRLLQAAVDAGVLLAAADGEVADEELEFLSNLLAELSEGQLTEAQTLAAIQASANEVSDGDGDARIAKIASTVSSEEDRETVLHVSAVVMLADGAAGEGDEKVLYDALAEAFEVDADRAEEILGEAGGAYGDSESEKSFDEESDEEDEDEDEEDSEDEEDEEGEDEEEEEEEEEDNTPVRKSSATVKDIMGRGASGNHVTRLQNKLVELGYSINVDGLYGPGTERAVADFQSNNGLDSDGIVGPDTKAALFGGSSSGGGGSSKSAGGGTSNVLQRGSRGSRVTSVQTALQNVGYELDADGVYGRGTAQAVLDFQRNNGLHADGVVGQRTWAALRPHM